MTLWNVFVDPDPGPGGVVRGAAAAVRALRLLVGGLLARPAVRGRRLERDAKWIELSPRARELLGIDEERVPPNEVIRAILRARVDLLWNSGIGTVVKAATETDADASDRSSDAIRVNADELRARVVRRGRQPRLHPPRAGRVRLTAGSSTPTSSTTRPASACSDHEVNLKILLGLAEHRGERRGPGATR